MIVKTLVWLASLRASKRGSTLGICFAFLALFFQDFFEEKERVSRLWVRFAQDALSMRNDLPEELFTLLQTTSGIRGRLSSREVVKEKRMSVFGFPGVWMILGKVLPDAWKNDIGDDFFCPVSLTTLHCGSSQSCRSHDALDSTGAQMSLTQPGQLFQFALGGVEIPLRLVFLQLVLHHGPSEVVSGCQPRRRAPWIVILDAHANLSELLEVMPRTTTLAMVEHIFHESNRHGQSIVEAEMFLAHLIATSQHFDQPLRVAVAIKQCGHHAQGSKTGFPGCVPGLDRVQEEPLGHVHMVDCILLTLGVLLPDTDEPVEAVLDKFGGRTIIVQLSTAGMIPKSGVIKAQPTHACRCGGQHGIGPTCRQMCVGLAALRIKPEGRGRLLVWKLERRKDPVYVRLTCV